MDKKRIEKRKTPSLAVSLMVFLGMLFLLGYVGGVLGMNLKLLTLCCIALLLIVAKFYQRTFGEMLEAAAEKFKTCVGFFLILCGIGFLISSYMMAGTAPILTIWLSGLVSDKFIIVLSFVLCAAMSEAVGTSFGTLGTLGVIMLSCAQVLGVNMAFEAAAIVSGILFGGFLSPFNDGFSSIPAIYNSNVQTMVRYNIVPTAISTVIAVVIFTIVGFIDHGNKNGDTSAVVETFREEVLVHFKPSVFVLVPLVMAIIFVFIRGDTIMNLYVSGFVGFLIAIFVQGFSPKICFEALYSGFSTEIFFPGQKISDGLAGLMNRGGIYAMADTVLFYSFMIIMAAMLSELGIFEAIRIFLVGHIKNVSNRGVLNLLTGVIVGLISLVTVDGIPTSMIARDFFWDMWKDNGYDPAGIMKFAQQWGNTTGQILPWTFCAIYFSNILGVSVGRWAPLTFFVYVIPILGCFLGFFGIGIDKLPTKEAD